jgi:hypothetical protein
MANAQYRVPGFELDVPSAPPADKLNDAVAHGSGIVTQGRVHTPWPLATDFTVPSTAFNGGTSSANGVFLAHLAGNSVPHLLEAYAADNFERVAMSLCDIAPGGPVRACRALETAIGNAGGADALVAKVSAVATEKTLEDALVLYRRTDDVQQQYQQAQEQYRNRCVQLDQEYVQLKEQVAHKETYLVPLQRRCQELERLKASLEMRCSDAKFQLKKAEDSWLSEFENLQTKLSVLRVDASSRIQQVQKHVAMGEVALDQLQRRRADLLQAREGVSALCRDLFGHQKNLEQLQQQRAKSWDEQQRLERECTKLETELLRQFEQAQERARRVGYSLTVTKV